MIKRINSWTCEDDDILRKVYPTASKKDVMNALPKRTWQAIVGRANHLMGIHRSGYRPFECYLKLKHYVDKFSDFEKGSLVALIIGEGCIGIHHQGLSTQLQLSPTISIANTDVNVIEYLNKIFHGIPLKRNIEQWKKEGNRKPTTLFRIRGLGVLALLETLEPYMFAKRNQTRLVIEFCESRFENMLEKGKATPYTRRELEIVAEVEVLNKKGVKNN